MKDLGFRRGLVVSSASERRSLGHGIELVPWADVVAGRADLF